MELSWIRVVPAICDCLVKLIEFRSRRAKERYDKLIAPVFESMRQIHDDYVRSIRTLGSTLNDRSVSADLIREDLTKLRMNLASLRVSTTSLVRAFLGSPWATRDTRGGRNHLKGAIGDFIEECIRYFESVSDVEPPEPTETGSSSVQNMQARRMVGETHFTGLMRRVDQYLAGKLTRHQLRDHTLRTVAYIEVTWVRISNAHARVKTLIFS